MGLNMTTNITIISIMVGISLYILKILRFSGFYLLQNHLNIFQGKMIVS